MVKSGFLGPHFPLIRGSFVFRSGVRFLFGARTEGEEKAILVSGQNFTQIFANKNLRKFALTQKFEQIIAQKFA